MSTIKNIVRIVGYQHLYSHADLVDAAMQAAHMPRAQQQLILQRLAESKPPIGNASKTKYDRRVVLLVRANKKEPWTTIASVGVCYNRMFTCVRDMQEFFSAAMREAKTHRKTNLRIVTRVTLRKSKTDATVE